jgi:hypothetical protein
MRMPAVTTASRDQGRTRGVKPDEVLEEELEVDEDGEGLGTWLFQRGGGDEEGDRQKNNIICDAIITDSL